MIIDKEQILSKMDTLFESYLLQHTLDFVNEVAMVRRVRKGKIVRKVKVKRKGFKVIRAGAKVKFVRMTQKEKRTRRKSARKAWRTSKSARKNKTKRTLRRSKVRMNTLYSGKKK